MNFQPDLELMTTNAKIYQMKQKPRPCQAEIGEALGVPHHRQPCDHFDNATATRSSGRVRSNRR